MSCERTRERLSPFLDAALDAAATLEVEEHLLACNDCQERHDGLRDVVLLLREIPAPVAPEGLSAAVMAALPDARPRAPFARPGPSLAFLVPFAAAACLLVIVGIANLRRNPGPEVEVARENAPRPAAVEEKLGAMRSSAELESEPDGRERTAGVDGGQAGSGGFRGPAGEIPPGQREPADPARKPKDTPETAGKSEGAEAADRGLEAGLAKSGEPRPKGGTARDDVKPRDELAASDGTAYRLSGADGDSAAGWILAELGRRRLGDALRDGDSDADSEAAQQVLQDADGAPWRLKLHVTRHELEFIRAMVEDERGARLTRIGVSPPAPAGPPAPESEGVPEASGPPPPEAPASTGTSADGGGTGRAQGRERADRRIHVEIRFGHR